jgi:hypothetical protein
MAVANDNESPMGKVFVYRFRRGGAVTARENEWGTLAAILSIEGSVPITRSAMSVDASLLDDTGFLPAALSPYDLLLESGAGKKTAP